MKNINKEKSPISIITYHMVPYSDAWGGSQRIYYMAEYLTKNGYDVTVYCIDQGTRDYNHKVNFKIVPLLLNSPLSQEDGLISNNKQDFGFKLYLKEKLIKPFVKKLFKLIFNDLSDFDSMQSYRFINKYGNMISEEIYTSGHKTVIISGPPFTLFNMVKPLRRNNKELNIILDYRDPWHIWNKGSGISRNLEKKLLKKVDGIIFTNKPLKNKTLSHFNLIDKKSVVVSNGYDEESWNGINYCKVKNKTLTINYVGSINISEFQSKYRDTTVFFKALENFIKKGNDIRVNFIGVSDVYNKTIQNYIKKFNGKVSFSPKVDKFQSLNKMLESDVLLLIHNVEDSSGEYIVNGKFYDYVASRKPIMYIGRKTDIHWKEIEKNELGFNSNNTCDSIFNLLTIIHGEWVRNNLSNNFCKKGLNNEYSRDFQYQNVLKLIKESNY